MFGIQASLDGINQLLVTFTNYHDIFIKVTNLWPQELPGNHTQCNKTNVEIQILYLECQWKPHIGIILCNAGMLKYIEFFAAKGVFPLLEQSQLNVQNQGIKGRNRPSNQRRSGLILDLHKINQGRILQNEQLERPDFDQINT